MGNTDLASVHVVVEGCVQGVFFRAFVSRRAEELGLSGYVRNLHDREAVEVQVEGEREKLERLINYLHVGPPSARAEMVDTNWSDYSGNYHGFSIRY